MTTTYPTVPDIKVVIGFDGVIRQVTVANDISDETMDAWLGRPWVDTVAGIDKGQLSDLVDGAIKDGFSPFFQLTQRFPSGLAIPFEYMTVRLDDRSGLVAIGRDVRAVAELLPASEMREVRDVKQESPRPAMDWVEQSPDGIAILNERGRIEQVNPAFLELLQEGTDVNVIGTELGKWLGRPGGDTHMLFDSLRRNGTVRLFPMTMHSALGSRIDVEVAAVMKNRSRPAMIGVYVRDVSRRVSSTQQLDRLGQFLGSMTDQVGKSRLKGMVATTVGLVERHYIEAALHSTDGNRTAAARLLGLSRQSLYVKLARYGIDGSDEEPR